MALTRLIVTGANGAGKSWFARRLSMRRPDLQVMSYDALQLAENWVKRPPEDIACAASAVIDRNTWVLEGGPSLLRPALPKAQGVVWLDPPGAVRAWRLAARPWKNFGKVRAELPDGNVDWPLQQYAFALRSLRKGRRFRASIKASLDANPPEHLWHARSHCDVDAALEDVVKLLADGS